MRRTARLVAVMVRAGCAGGCGGSPAVVVAPSTAASAQSPAMAVTEKRADLSPVTKPKTVMVVARFNDIGRTIDSVDSVLRLPTTLRSLLLATLQTEDADFGLLSGALDFACALT